MWEFEGDGNPWDLEKRGRKLTGSHRLGWLPGIPGKGFVWAREGAEPAVYTWNTDESGLPAHQHTIEENMIPYREMKAPFDIDPYGTVTVPQEWDPTFNSSIGYNLAELQDVDPRLQFVPASEWEDASWDVNGLNQ
jgi:hypothetical protein